jgi:hypothetical protein
MRERERERERERARERERESDSEREREREKERERERTLQREGAAADVVTQRGKLEQFRHYGVLGRLRLRVLVEPRAVHGVSVREISVCGFGGHKRGALTCEPSGKPMLVESSSRPKMRKSCR